MWEVMHFLKHCFCHGQSNEPYNQEIKTPSVKCSFFGSTVQQSYELWSKSVPEAGSPGFDAFKWTAAVGTVCYWGGGRKLWPSSREISCSGSDAASQDFLHSGPEDNARFILEFVLGLLGPFSMKSHCLAFQ